MEWSNEKVLQLISEYENRPLLWDPKDWNYKNRVKKNKAWEEIAQLFHISHLEVERKFKILLVQYRREKSKILKMVEAGYDLADLEACAWYAYKSFRFLSKRSRLMRTSDGVNNDRPVNCNKIEYEEIKIEPTSDEYEAVSNENYIEEFLESTIEETPEAKRRKFDIINSNLQLNCNCKNADDDINLFVSYIGSEMRNLSNDQLRRKLKRKILKAVLEACEENDLNQA